MPAWSIDESDALREIAEVENALFDGYPFQPYLGSHQKGCIRIEWRSEQDLQAQCNMARWAFWSAFAALISVCVTTVGIIFIKQTLDATRDAVREAGKGTAVAALAVEETKRAK